MVDFEDLNVTQLRKFVRLYNSHMAIRGYTKLSKEELIKEIRKYFKIENNMLISLKEANENVKDIVNPKKKVIDTHQQDNKYSYFTRSKAKALAMEQKIKQIDPNAEIHITIGKKKQRKS